ncbi:MAG: archaemetzincin family Zn-dependent metalloprotease [Bryobacteraceae bacterium]
MPEETIHLISAGLASEPATGAPIEMLDDLAARLARVFEISCHVLASVVEVDFAHDPIRNQHMSTSILARLAELREGELFVNESPGARLLGVTALDLFVPVLTFVFGEAQLDGRCGVVSTHRLREEHYGQPPNPELLAERLAKEAAHELGHTYGLRHCDDWSCVMASTHSVERLDLKGVEFCASCGRVVRGDRRP